MFFFASKQGFEKTIIYKSILENSKKDEPLNVAKLAPYALGKNLACGVVRQSVMNSTMRNTAWQV